MKKLYCLIGALLLMLNSQAQSPASKKMRPWRICETVPEDLKLKSVINYTDSVFSFAAFQKKLIILDFWNTYCPSCIRAFPKIDSLQRKFKGRVQFLLVTAEPKQQVASFLANKLVQMRLNLSIPIVTEDTLLNMLNTPRCNPHYVWVEPGGQVLGATTGFMLSEAAIEAVLKSIQ